MTGCRARLQAMSFLLGISCYLFIYIQDVMLWVFQMVFSSPSCISWHNFYKFTTVHHTPCYKPNHHEKVSHLTFLEIWEMLQISNVFIWFGLSENTNVTTVLLNKQLIGDINRGMASHNNCKQRQQCQPLVLHETWTPVSWKVLVCWNRSTIPSLQIQVHLNLFITSNFQYHHCHVTDWIHSCLLKC